MAKDNFNSVSSRQNAIEAPKFETSSSFVIRDKLGREIRSEGDIRTARIRTADGGYMTVRAGKPIEFEAPPEKKHQEDKKVALTSSEDRRNQRVKTDLDRKAKNLEL